MRRLPRLQERLILPRWILQSRQPRVLPVSQSRIMRHGSDLATASGADVSLARRGGTPREPRRRRPRSPAKVGQANMQCA